MLTEPSSSAITMVTQSENLPQTFPMVTTSGGDPQFQMVTTSSEVQFLQVQNHMSDCSHYRFSQYRPRYVTDLLRFLLRRADARRTALNSS
ncbi:hypothetical protein ScPMuIL_013112 [Solemya velum]